MLCDCYVSLPKPEELDKLANRRIKAVHLGWDSRRRGYFVFIPELNRVTTVVDIDFLEHSFSSLGIPTPPVRDKRKKPEQRDLPVPTGRNQLPAPPAPSRCTRPWLLAVAQRSCSERVPGARLSGAPPDSILSCRSRRRNELMLGCPLV